MERQLDYWPPGATQPVPVRVRIEVPYLDPEQDWETRLTIEGFPGRPTFSRPLHGEGPLEVLSEALCLAPLLLSSMTRRGARLTQNGSERLGFPSALSGPSQDWLLSPTGGGEPRKLWVRLELPDRIEDRWSVLLTSTECKTWGSLEKRFEAPTWPEALERAAAAVPALLREHAEKLGGGTLEEIHTSPSCSVECPDPPVAS